MQTIILTGLSGSGKTTLAKGVLGNPNHANLIHLDGDDIRLGLNKDLGYSLEDREENIRRISCISKLINDQGISVIASFIFPTKKLRQIAKTIIGNGKVIIVYVECSLEECIRRDPKGLYKSNTPLMTGIEQLYEYPTSPDIIINTEELDPIQSIKKLREFIIRIIWKPF
jgi:adenylyl-sulfate kinase